jgi:hypothetical protein
MNPPVNSDELLKTSDLRLKDGSRFHLAVRLLNGGFQTQPVHQGLSYVIGAIVPHRTIKRSTRSGLAVELPARDRELRISS